MNLPDDDLPSEIRTGIDMINEGLYFKAHEIMETRWILEKGKVRNLYRGLIQLSAALYHLERGNTRGAIKLLNMAEENIKPYEQHVFSFDILQLLSDIQKLRDQILSTPTSEVFINRSGLFHFTNHTVQ